MVWGMGKLYEVIDAKLADWIVRQPLFFVGTAPGAGGHVNVSPKGPIGTLRILDERRVAYLDFIGSGVETIAHLRDDGRIVIMLCAFEGPPRIVRLHGRGRVAELGTPEYDELAPPFADVPDVDGRAAAARSVIVVDVERVADSCGYGVPLMSYEGERRQQLDWIDRKLEQSPSALEDYKAEKNAESIDGLPGLSL
jgi:hypothetical protein